MTTHDPNDELNPQHELASAYLDGVASPDERAEVEASSELQALVASFTQVRAQVADVPTAGDDRREAAFAAAFAEFDSPAAALPTEHARAAAVIPLSSKRRWARPVLSVAAAVLLVGVIGVAAKGGLSGDDKSSSSMDTNAKNASDDAATEMMASDTAAGMPQPTIGYIPSGADVAVIVNTPEELLALSVYSTASQLTVAGGAPESTAAAAETSDSADSTAAPADNARSANDCLTVEQEYLAEIQYQGTYAIAARDTVTGMISAITDDCTVLATVGP